MIAKQGLETGSRSTASHVVSNGTVTFVLISPICVLNDLDRIIATKEQALLTEIHDRYSEHGVAIKDIAFELDSVHTVYEQAVRKGAKPVQPPIIHYDEVDGDIITAVIKTFGDTTHTLFDRSDTKGRSCQDIVK